VRPPGVSLNPSHPTGVVGEPPPNNRARVGPWSRPGGWKLGLVRRPQLTSPSRGPTLVVAVPSSVTVTTEPCEDVGHGRLRVPSGLRLIRLSAARLEQPLISASPASPEPISPSLRKRHVPLSGRAKRSPLPHDQTVVPVRYFTPSPDAA
jgi:hypothetical protein